MLDDAARAIAWLTKNYADFVGGVVVSVFASFVFAWIRPAWRVWRSELDDYREARNSSLPLEDGSIPRDPRGQIRFVFYKLRLLDRRLEGLSYVRRGVAAGDILPLVVMYFLLTVLAAARFVGMEWGATIFAFLVLSSCFASMAVFYLPDSTRVFMVAFPFVWLTVPYLLGARVAADRGRLVAIDRARWHLLLATPSSNSARTVIGRQSEHLHHVRQTIAILSTLAAEPEIAAEVGALMLRANRVATVIEAWPSTCSPYLAVGLRPVRQVTVSKLEADGA